MDFFQYYYQWELDYLKQLGKLSGEEKPHLAKILGEYDPDIERVNQGFSALMARVHQKVDDAFPEMTLPLLQRLNALPVKGIPATSVVQFNAAEGDDITVTFPKYSEVSSSSTGTKFLTSRACDIEPLILVARNITYQAETSCITLTFQYTGRDDHWLIRPIRGFVTIPSESSLPH